MERVPGHALDQKERSAQLEAEKQLHHEEGASDKRFDELQVLP
jgi:hypothetical protein